MITQAPLPTWFNLIRALLRRPPTDTDLAAPWHRDGEIAGWLSRSAWSLALIALWRMKSAPELPITVWIPDFFCNAALAALRQTGAKLVFYPLNGKMAPDITACRTLADSNPPDMLVLVHYFGQPTPAAATRDFCALHGAWLIEDAAHVLRPQEGIGAYGDFVLYSPHKHLPIPDGAVLVVRTAGSGQFGVDLLASFDLPPSWPGQLSALQQELGCSVNNGRARSVVWLVKRVLQKLGVRHWRLSATRFAEPLIPNQTDHTCLGVPTMSRLARRLLAGLLSELGGFARQRRRHQLLWDFLMLNEDASFHDAVSTAERAMSREWTPYIAAYNVNAATAEMIFDQWSRYDVPVTTWPDLPPEVTTHRERHATAWHLRHSRLYLPVHQNLSVRKLVRLRSHRQPSKVNEPRLTLVWDAATREQWQQWIAQTGRSNLLQSWIYGEAKSNRSGWRVKRGVFYRDSIPVAIVQVLQKHVTGLLCISRINRGPLFITTFLPHEQRAVWSELAQLGNIWRGQVLTVAPELSLSGSSLTLMDGLGFLQFSPLAWESVWIDLGIELNTLRKRIDGKWRNMLNFSEKTGLKLEIGSDDELFNWMMARYQELMQEKNFSGPDADFLQYLRQHAGGEESLLILQAVHEDEPVAGICIFRHGSAATYLLGWNGDKGRKLKANQYLLWQAITHLNQSGLRWFDLGGINEEQTPGITAFKLGLNGDRYELVGEYWKW